MDKYALHQYGLGWHDENDRLLESFDDYDEEFEFGDGEHNRFVKMVKQLKVKWNPLYLKHVYEKHPKPLILRVKRG